MERIVIRSLGNLSNPPYLEDRLPRLVDMSFERHERLYQESCEIKVSRVPTYEEVYKKTYQF